MIKSGRTYVAAVVRTRTYTHDGGLENNQRRDQNSSPQSAWEADESGTKA